MKKTRKKQKEQGVTLIALVVTIVVLLILAATSIAMLTGDDGIITNAQKAQVANQEAEVIDKMGLAYSTVRTEAMVKMSTNPGYQPIEHIEELANIAAKEIGLENAEKAEVPETVNDGYHVYYQENGSTITMLYGDNKFSLKAGNKASNNKYPNIKGVISLSTTEVVYSKLPTGVGGNSSEQNPSQGKIMEENTNYVDSEGNTAIIPKGFCVVKGTSPISKGLVISDVAEDDMENSKGGNQFVWVPVDGENLKYEQHKYTTENPDDHKGTISDKGNGNWRTFQYRNYTGWTDTDGNTESVEKNKGFYVGRYEAGIPKEAPFYSVEDGSTYWQSNYSNDNYGKNSLTEGSYTTTNKSKNVTTYAPVSKKNTPSWNYISQINAKTVSSKMYGEDKGVTSSLIDSYAYDTVSQWLSNSSYNVASDSMSWGNYYNSEYLINGLYAKHEFKQDPTDSTGKTIRWYPAFTWSKGEYNKKSGDRFEIATGSSERNKANNIYDFAGNMWEWTTETRRGTRRDWNNETKKDTVTSEQTFVILRGGSYHNDGNNSPASARYGSATIGSGSVSFGFRVVLYIK